MEAFATLQYKVLFEVIPTFAQSIQASKSVEDLKAPTRKMFDQVMQIVYPDEILAIKPKVHDP